MSDPRRWAIRFPNRSTVAAVLSVAAAAAASSASLAQCPGDLDGNGTVDGADLGSLLGAWGGRGPADLDGNGVVDGADLGMLLGAFGQPCGGPIDIELVGQPLAAAPFFAFVDTFNSGSTVRMAVDPTRVPAVVGRTALVYVTAHRSSDAWAADPALVDVRAGGPQLVSFLGASVQDNIVDLDAGTLGAGNGLELGAAYDVVVDLDGDGMLGAGDLVDGLGRDGGFFVVPDLTAAGPLAVTTTSYAVTGVTSGFASERCYYPTDIETMGALPLVVISHGNGHLYTWYDWLGQHLASWGFVVMSHQNNTGAGVQAASTTTLQHTQSFLGQLATIAGGVLDGHVDGGTIVWIGHSRGGEGVVRAYDRIVDGTFTPSNYGAEDIVLISSIAPTDFLGTSSSTPHDAPYHFIYGSADGDVCGCPDNDIAQAWHLYERAEGWRQSTYIHGADHNDFNCCGFNDFQGPSGTQIGRPEVQRVAKATYLALLKHRIEGSAAAGEFLFRPYASLRPLSVGDATRVVLDLREDWAVAIDDYQSESSSGTSSSGGAVAFTVTNLVENPLNDANSSFSWLSSDAFNGMTRARTSDFERGVVFDYDAPASYELEIVPALRDFRSFAFLSLRGAQGTRHPRTTAEQATLTFTVTLRDGAGVERSVAVGAYKSGLQEPYQRTGFGSGAGWQNELEVVRVRLTDFLADGSALDLSDIVAVRLDFGMPGDSTQGRVALDDIMLVPAAAP